MSPIAIEIIGYVASVLVAVSLTMSNLVKLRWINLAGAVVFTLYGVLLGAWPVAVVNAFIAVVNVRFLKRMSDEREAFDLFDPDEGRGLLDRFVAKWGDDIRGFFPDASLPSGSDARPDGARVRLVLRDLAPAALVAWRRDGDTVHVDVDYAAPPYRDRKAAAFLYEALVREWAADGVTRAVANPVAAEMRGYFTSCGFREEGGALVRSVAA